MALTLKQRGLTTQSYGVQNNGAPGDLGAIDSGSFTRRPYGPSLAGWPMGWAAHTSNADARHILTIAAASGEDLKGMFGAWYFFGPGTVTLSGEVELINVTNQLGGNEYEGLRLHVGTMSLDLLSLNARFPDALNIKTVRRNWWVWLGLAWEYRSGSADWIMKVLYREAGSGTTQVIYTTAAYTTGGGPNLMNGARGGAIAPAGSTSVIAIRYALPSLYQMTVGMADAAYPSEIAEPLTGPNNWYVATNAAGGGTGVSPAQAWTPAEFVTNTGNNFTVMSGDIVDGVGVKWDTDSLNVDALEALYEYGIAIPNGDKIYLDDTGGPIRPLAVVDFKLCDGFQCLPLPTLGRRVEVRGTKRISSAWTLISGSSYKIAHVGDHPVLLEFDSVAEADSQTGKARWLAHPVSITTAAGFAAVATDGSFGTDGGGGVSTEIYTRTTGSGNPGSNGKVYEATVATDIFQVNCRGGLIKNLAVRYNPAVGTNNNSGTDNTRGYCVSLQGDGMVVIDGCDTIGGGRHQLPILQGLRSAKHRAIILNVTSNDSIPAAYCGTGGQSIFVTFGTTDGADNQWYLKNCIVTTNAGVVGSTAGNIDVTQEVMTDHNDLAAPNTKKPFSKGFVINSILPGQNTIGWTAASIQLQGNALGTAGLIPGPRSTFGGPGGTLTMTQNRIIDTGLPNIGLGLAGVTLATIRSNLFVATGAVGTTNGWVGTINFDGNTVDGLALTGGATKALATRAGVVVANVRGNIFRFNNADPYRLFDTITPVSGDVLTMVQNQFEGSSGGNPDVNRILVIAYAGANTKTLAQLVAGGQDTGSAWTTDIKADPATYRIAGDSPARNFVSLASIPALASTVDFNGRQRNAAGLTDAGAEIYINTISGLARLRSAGARGIRVGRKF